MLTLITSAIRGACTSRPEAKTLWASLKTGPQVRPFGGAPYKNMNAAG